MRLTKLSFSWGEGMDEPEFSESEAWVNPATVIYVEHEDYIWFKTETVYPRSVVHFANGMSLAVKEPVADCVRKLVGGGVRAVERCGETRTTFGNSMRCTKPAKHGGECDFEGVT